MFAVLVRTLCGALVLAGVVSQSNPSARVASDPRGPGLGATKPPLDSATPGAGEPGSRRGSAPVYRLCRVTAYCDRGLTATGVSAGAGQCAAPADIPFGSRVYVAALGRTFVVTDRTARRFRHNTVDLFIPDRTACLEFGCRYLECEITFPARGHRCGSPRLRALVAAGQG